MKLCVNCKYFKTRESALTRDGLSFYRDACTHTTAIREISPVSGSVSFREAALMRVDEDRCGRDANLFEEKPTLWSKIKWLVKKKNTNKLS